MARDLWRINVRHTWQRAICTLVRIFNGEETTFISIRVMRDSTSRGPTVRLRPLCEARMETPLRESFDPLNLHKGTPRIAKRSIRSPRETNYAIVASSLFELAVVTPDRSRLVRVYTPRWTAGGGNVVSRVPGSSFPVLSRARCEHQRR